MKLPAFIRSARSEASSKGLFDFSLVVLGLVILALVLMICLSGVMSRFWGRCGEDAAAHYGARCSLGSLPSVAELNPFVH